MIEISTAGFPLPVRIPVDPGRIIKEDWVVIRDSDRMYATLTELSFALSRDEKGLNVYRTVQLDCAAVTKGKKNGNPALVVADPNGKLLMTVHNSGVLQEWFNAIKTAIVIACALKYEPESVSSLRK